MIMHSIWNIHDYIYVMKQYTTSWNIGWILKELVCGHGEEGSIPFDDILNLVLNNYNMIICVINYYNMITCAQMIIKWLHLFIYFKCKSIWTLHIVVLDMTWHHVMLSCLNKMFGMTLMTIVI
jgi:hypothetical protein